ncbi:MAG: hypothetical protein ACR2P2_17570 [Nakamurella sp.]
MIRSFGSKDTERIWREQYVKGVQWRICFVWREGGADDVELVDYH